MEQPLYELPEGWRWEMLGDVAHTTSGGTPKRTEKTFWAGRIPWIKSGELGDSVIEKNQEFITELGLAKSSAKIFPSGSLLIALYGATAGKLGVLSYDAATNQAVCCIKPINDSFVRDFARYYLLQKRKQIIEDSFGGAQPNISQSYLRNLRIPLPSLSEQKRIVAKLDALFTRIDAAITHLQETLELSNALFASALVKIFEENSNWRSTTVKEVFNVVNGRAYKKQELLDSGKYQVVRIQNLKGGEAYYYSDLELKSDKYCDTGDLLFSWSGTPGTSFGAFIWQGEKSIYHYHIWKMEPLVELNIRFAYWLLRDLTEEAIASSRGVAGMLHITKGMMESFSVQLPSIEEQALVANYLDKLEERTRTLDAETQERLDQLATFKSSLLDAAFRGQL